MRVDTAIQIATRALKTRDYTPERIIDGLAMAGNYLCRNANIVTSTATVSTVASTATVDISSITGLRIPRVRSIFADDYPVRPKSLDNLRTQRRNAGVGSGRPSMWAEQDSDTLLLWPVPSAVYSLSITYAAPFTDVYSAENPELNVPDEFVMDLLMFGVPPCVEMNDPSAAYQSESWKKFTETIVPQIASLASTATVNDPNLEDFFDESTP